MLLGELYHNKLLSVLAISVTLHINNQNPSSKNITVIVFCCFVLFFYNLCSPALCLSTSSLKPFIYLEDFSYNKVLLWSSATWVFSGNTRVQKKEWEFRSGPFFKTAFNYDIHKIAHLSLARTDGRCLSFYLPVSLPECFTLFFYLLVPFAKKVMDYTVTSPLFSSSSLSLALYLSCDGVWNSSMIYHQLKALDGVTLNVCVCHS